TARTFTYSYDSEDQPTLVRGPAPGVATTDERGDEPLDTRYAYDAAGNVIVAVDARGQITRYSYDERDLLREVCQSRTPWRLADPLDPSTAGPCQAGSIRTDYDYDNFGNPTRVN